MKAEIKPKYNDRSAHIYTTPMKWLVERNNKQISVYLCDGQIECCTFNIIQHQPTTEIINSGKDVLLY